MCCHGRPVETQLSRCDATQRHIFSSSSVVHQQLTVGVIINATATIIGSHRHSAYDGLLINAILAAISHLLNYLLDQVE